MNIKALADTIVAHHLAIAKIEKEHASGSKSKAHAVAVGRLNGILKAADALQITRYGNGISGITIDLHDIIREKGECPEFRFTGKNVEYKAWCNEVSEALVNRAFREEN